MSKFFPLLLLALLPLIGCNPSPELNRNKYREENYFPVPDGVEKSGAFLVLEWNGRKPWIVASGNLIDKKAGLIQTAKHFTDDFGSLGVDYCKVFLMNGKVYKATLVKVPPVRDAALIKLVPPFNADELPNPLLIASEMPKLGDTIYIQGFHPHSYQVRKSNEKDGFSDTIIEIFETYYGQKMMDLSKESQAVFDNLKGKTIRPDPESVEKKIYLDEEQKKNVLTYENDGYMKVLMARDHKFSFGGLSGGAALNGKGEMVGIITAQDIFRFEFDENGLFYMPGGDFTAFIKNQLFDTIYVTLIDSIKDLYDHTNSR